MRRVLDFSYVDGCPAAIRSWVVIDGRRAPGIYHLLDPDLLRMSVPAGTWWYDGVVNE